MPHEPSEPSKGERRSDNVFTWYTDWRSTLSSVDSLNDTDFIDNDKCVFKFDGARCILNMSLLKSKPTTTSLTSSCNECGTSLHAASGTLSLTAVCQPSDLRDALASDVVSDQQQLVQEINHTYFTNAQNMQAVESRGAHRTVSMTHPHSDVEGLHETLNTAGLTARVQFVNSKDNLCAELDSSHWNRLLSDGLVSVAVPGRDEKFRLHSIKPGYVTGIELIGTD